MNLRIAWPLIWGLIVPMSLPAWTPGPALAREPDTIRVDGSRLSGRVADAPLDRLLREIADQSGLAIHVHGDAGAMITTIDLRGVPLEEGLQRLLRDTAAVFVYAAHPDGESTEAALTEIHVYPATARGAVLDPIPAFPRATVATPATIANARRLLDAPERVSRRRAARDLGRSGDAGAVAALSDALEREEDAAVRETMVRALDRARSSDAVRALSRAALTDPDDGVRETAAGALGRTWSETAVLPLLAALGDAQAEVRAAAAAALGETWNGGAVEALARAVMADPSVRARESAARALRRLDADAAIGPLTLAIHDPSPRIRRVAGEILGEIAAAEGSPRP
jgi:HEAT repeat protein